MSDAPIRVLVVDDHPIVRAGIIALVQDHPRMDLVAEAGTGEEAVTLALTHRPDVILMDLRLPTMSGVEAIQTIRASWPDARVIVLTTYDGDEDIYQALHAGAKAYLLKDASREELLEAVEAVHRGEKRIPPEVGAILAGRIAGQDLTPRERDVLHGIVEGRSNKEIGQALSLSEGTVKFHVNNILAKLDVRDRTQAATEAIRRGLVRA
ncbi:MAG TPA: response regulator transcription factor [Thermomicrobiales bacterium]|jgi:two-component system NarL family response regulator|nr:response regulator transcription factor [Thermomicrobiales bacterium]